MAKKIESKTCKTGIKKVKDYLWWYKRTKKLVNSCRSKVGYNVQDCSGWEEAAKMSSRNLDEKLKKIARACGDDTAEWLRALSKEK